MTPQKIGLAFCLFAAFVLCGEGFEFHWCETPSFKKQLECSVDANSSSLDIFTIIDLTIFDVSSNNTSVKLAAISVLNTDLYVRHASKSFLAVEGSVSQHDAELVVTFSNQTYCSFCSYLCELNFINSAGHPVVRHITVRSTPAESDSSYSEVSVAVVTNQIMAAVDRLNGITNGVEDRLTEMAAINEKTENRLAEMAATNEEPKLALARLEEKLDNITALLTTAIEINKELKILIPETNICRKGMANVTNYTGNHRILVTVLDNKTALCDTNTDGGGWIIFQRRSNGRENFYRSWEDYKSGFGDVEGGGDYWLGLQSIHEITSKGLFELLVDMEQGGTKYYAHYSEFHVGNDIFSNYRLRIGEHSGNATDQLKYHKDMPFTTLDKDSDRRSSGNCAVVFRGAWWYKDCYHSNLNGMWGATDNTGINWSNSFTKLLTFTEMKMRQIS